MIENGSEGCFCLLALSIKSQRSEDKKLNYSIGCEHCLSHQVEVSASFPAIPDRLLQLLRKEEPKILSVVTPVSSDFPAKLTLQYDQALPFSIVKSIERVGRAQFILSSPVFKRLNTKLLEFLK